MTTLAAKFHVKPGMTVVVDHPPDALARALKTAFAGCVVAQRGGIETDFILLFASSVKELGARFPKALSSLGADTPLWIAYPKRSGSIPSDLTRDHGWEVVREAGFRPVSLVALDATWSALRFRKTELVQSRKK